MDVSTLAKIKTDLRVSHNLLDDDIIDSIASCLRDLEICGIANPDDTDKAILNVLKLWCRADYTDDTNKAAAYMERYGDMKSTLMMAAGYGGSNA